jgi:hypothetical protein
MLNAAMQAQHDPQDRKDFISKRLNVFTAAVKAYFNLREFIVSNEKCGAALGIDPTLPTAKKIELLRKLPINWFGGADLSKVVKTTVYIKNMNDFPQINELYGAYFKSPYPARSLVEVARLPKDVLIEIEAVARVSL